MNILSVNTGNEKQDEAYRKMQEHISKFDNFNAFFSYFKNEIKTDDKEKLNMWLLKVLFIEFRYGRSQEKHDFDKLIDLLEDKGNSQKAQELKTWIKNSIFELEQGGGNER